MALFSVFLLSLFVFMIDGNAATRCPVNITTSVVPVKSSVVVFVEQYESSLTNGVPYSKTYSPWKVILNETQSVFTAKMRVSRSNLQTMQIAYNGSHICVAAELMLSEDLYTRREINETNTCVSTCFAAANYFERHSIQLFSSKTSSFSIGEWTMSDGASIYTSENKKLSCYHRNESYSWDENLSWSNLKLDVVECPLGEKCRITTAQKNYKWDPILYYIGCENEYGHFDGCLERCEFQKYQRSLTGSGSDTWRSGSNTWRFGSDTIKLDSENWRFVCRYCCEKDFCNYPAKCEKLECNLAKTIVSGSEATYLFRRSSLCIFIFFCLSILL